MKRISAGAILGLTASFGLLTFGAFPQDKSKKPAPPPAPASRHSASCPKDCSICKGPLDKALAFLAKDILTEVDQPYVQEVVPFAISGLAFLAEGSTPSKGKYTGEIKKCMQGIFDYYNTGKKDRTLNHWGMSFTSLFFLEIYTREPKDHLKKPLVETIKLLETGQEKDGGWAHGSQPQSSYKSLTAVTVMTLTALINMKKAGFEVNDGVIRKGIQYLEQCTMEGIPEKSFNNAVGYRIEESRFRNNKYYEPSPARTAMALYTVLQSGNDINRPPFTKWTEYLKRDMKRTLYFAHGSFHLCYLYQALGSYKLGGEYWDQFRQECLDRLLATQDGSGASRFISDTARDLSKSAKGNNAEVGTAKEANPHIDDTYRTAILAIILQLPLENLAVVTGKFKTDKK